VLVLPVVISSTLQARPSLTKSERKAMAQPLAETCKPVAMEQEGVLPSSSIMVVKGINNV
jgi:hypothetical protein